MNHVYFGDNLEILKSLPDGHANLIYIDPPFNTGRTQARTRIKTIRDDHGDRVGFKGNTYRTIKIGTRAYNDIFDDYLGFLEPRLIEARRVLAPDGAFFFHIDYREVHYCKVLLDQIFGRESFINELIWAYDYGARSKSRWPAKHDNILFYAKDPENFVFDLEACDRIPYMAPGLVGEEKAARGKSPTDVWWHTIVSPTGREKTGYPTQKPLGILRRLIKVHTKPGDVVLDFFGGSGTTGIAAAELGRRFILCDQNPEAVAVIKMRMAEWETEFHGCEHIQAVERNGYVAPPDAATEIPPAPHGLSSEGGMPTRTSRSVKDASRSPFHVLLEKAMAARKVTTGGLARATAVSFPTVQKIVGGAMPGRQSTIDAFAKFLGVDPNELIRLIAGTGSNPSHPIDRAMETKPDEVGAEEGTNTKIMPVAPMGSAGATDSSGVQQSLF